MRYRIKQNNEERMFSTHAQIGIWGLGIVGISAIKFFSRKGYTVSVLEKKTLTPSEIQMLHENNADLYTGDITSFLQTHDYIAASPGIDLRPYAAYQDKFITELDIFQHYYHHPVVAITGSVGKTSITHLLSTILLQAQKNIVTGGNIGTGMLDLIDDKQHDFAILEVSSFQLEHCKTFSPDLALWTNLYANHLDRHGTFENYFLAKLNLIKHQSDMQHALVPYELANQLRNALTGRSFNFFSPYTPAHVQLNPNDALYYVQDNHIMKLQNGRTRIIRSLSVLPTITYQDNWLIIGAALDILGFNPPLEQFDYTLPAHRLEKVATINHIHFYDDSKATIPQSTLAAVRQLRGNRLLLFLGGVSKGVDRSSLIAQLPSDVKHIFCFGKEAEQLKEWCNEYLISATAHVTLQEAFNACIQIAQANDHVLFSPSGASFDLFSNYQERGNQFKKLVHDLSA